MTTTASSSVVFVGDEGTRIQLNCRIDVSSALVLEIHYQKPDGTTGSWTATLALDPEKIYHDTVAGDLDAAGRWKLQSYIETPTWKGHGRIAELHVYSPL